MRVPLRIEVSGGERLVVTWDDGTSVSISAAELRSACPCAHCGTEAGAARTRAVLADPEQVHIGGARLVGAYGLNLEFEPDHHATGIFSFELLAALGGTGGDQPAPRA